MQKLGEGETVYMQLRLPETLKERMRDRSRRLGFISMSEYLRALICKEIEGDKKQ